LIWIYFQNLVKVKLSIVLHDAKVNFLLFSGEKNLYKVQMGLQLFLRGMGLQLGPKLSENRYIGCSECVSKEGRK
jgi:hypothetical protein